MRHASLVMAAALALGTGSAGAGDWPQWRGPTHDGVSAEPSNWPAGWPPRRLWSAAVGAGCTSPIMAEGRLFVMGWTGQKRTGEGTDTVYAFDSRTGRQIWKQTYPARYQGRFRAGDTGAYGGPSATPAFDPAAGRLYTLGVDGDLRCWDGRGDGRLVWAVNLYDRFKAGRRPNVGGGQRDYGSTCAPLICGELLIVQAGGVGGTVVALEKETGQTRWQGERTGPAGHSGGIVPLRLGNAQVAVVLTLSELVIIRVDDGKTVARQGWQTEYGCNLPTPAIDGNRILLTAGYNQRKAALFDLTSGAAEPVWQSGAFATVASPVVAGGRTFIIENQLQCVDLAGGRLLWKGGSFGHGSCIATSDGKLIVFGNGRLALVDAAADQYRQLAVVEGLVKGTCYPHVALAGGVIACKDRDGGLVCLGTRKNGE